MVKQLLIVPDVGEVLIIVALSSARLRIAWLSSATSKLVVFGPTLMILTTGRPSNKSVASSRRWENASHECSLSWRMHGELADDVTRASVDAGPSAS